MSFPLNYWRARLDEIHAEIKAALPCTDSVEWQLLIETRFSVRAAIDRLQALEEYEKRMDRAA